MSDHHSNSGCENILSADMIGKKIFSSKEHFDLLDWVLKLADKIFTDSEFSKNDIASVYNYPKNKIYVTYLGIGNEFKKINKFTAKSYIREKLGIKNDYIFFINTGRPRKLLEAFKGMLKKVKKPLSLVILGDSSKGEKKVVDLVKELNIENNIYFINSHISDIDLNNLYSGAEFFVSPSFYEGFGLTPLEALKSGCPVLISNVTALPEIYKNAALYCDPTSVLDMKKKLILLNKSKILKTNILRNSKKIIVNYTWDKVAYTSIKYLS